MSHFLYRKFLKPIFTINDTPHSIALGVVLGVFVALTPTVGFQMIIVAVIGTFIKANRIIGVILCWISNPITFIPMYYGYYWVGGKVMASDLWTFSNFSDKMEEVRVASETLGFWEALKPLGAETLLPLFVGSLIVATICSIPLYPIALAALVKHRRRNGLDEMGKVLPQGEPQDLEDKKEEETEVKQANDKSPAPPAESPADDCVQSTKKSR